MQRYAPGPVGGSEARRRESSIAGRQAISGPLAAGACSSQRFTSRSPRRSQMKVNAIYGMMQACRAGIVIAMLPDYVTETETTLKRVLTGGERIGDWQVAWKNADGTAGKARNHVGRILDGMVIEALEFFGFRPFIFVSNVADDLFDDVF